MATREKVTKKEEYGADEIVKLEGLEAVRHRPDMYIGNTDKRGLHHLIWEIVDNAVDEALAGHCNKIIVKLEDDNIVSVRDNGRGVPIGKNSKTGESALHMVFEELHAGGKFEGKGYKVSGGLHGVGASVTNALSEWLEVEVYREGYSWSAAWARGKRTISLQKGKKSREQGTLVRWKFDKQIFKDEYDISLIAQRLREKSYLVRGLEFVFQKADGSQQIFLSQNGIKDYVTELASEREAVHKNTIDIYQDECAVMRDEEEINVSVDVALAWTKKPHSEDQIFSFANVVTTPDGGVHVTGLKGALTKAINNYGMETGKLKKDKANDRFDSRDITRYLTAAVSVNLPQPKFEGQTKAKLNNPEARTAVQSVVYASFSDWLSNNKNAKDAKLILEQCLLARKVRQAKAKVSTQYDSDSIFATSKQSAKLADCLPSGDPEDKELMIVEGDSAGGSMKLARDGKFQAILPLKGKPVNVITASNKLIFDNEEIKSLITALGGRIDQAGGENIITLPREKRRYGKVLIVADADTDGAHISYLVMGILYEFFPELIKEGRVFIARPPLYRVQFDKKGENYQYAYSDDEKDALSKGKQVVLSRFKGLGEMNKDHLYETVTNPKTRKLYQVTIEDAGELAEAVNLILGNSAQKRREWLAEGAGKKYQTT